MEYTIPYLKEGAFFVAYKSLKAGEEIKNAKNALKILNSEIVEKIEYSLPIEEENKSMKKYKCSKTWKGHTNKILSLIELNTESEFIATGSCDKKIIFNTPDTLKLSVI